MLVNNFDRYVKRNWCKTYTIIRECLFQDSLHIRTDRLID